MYDELKRYNVEIRGDEKVRGILPDVNAATEEDWGREYLDYVIAVKVVDSIDEAIEHISKYGTKHSKLLLQKIIQMLSASWKKLMQQQCM